MSVSPTRTAPLLGVSKPASKLSRVLLPLPDGPTTEVRPAAKVCEKDRSAVIWSSPLG